MDVDVGFNPAGLKVVGTIVTGAVVVGGDGAGAAVELSSPEPWWWEGTEREAPSSRLGE